MKVVVRTDASEKIGSGHLMRTLTLAEKLRDNRCEVIFVCRELEGNLCDYVEKRGFGLIRIAWNKSDSTQIDRESEYASWLAVSLEREIKETKKALSSIGPIDWLIVDHYALGQQWERVMRPLVGAIMVIDDLANRPHDCDLILDQNLDPDLEQRYDSLTPAIAVKLLGPQYALLREEFRRARVAGIRSRMELKRVLLCFGGVDFTNETGKGLEALAPFSELEIDLIVGTRNPNLVALKQQIADDLRVTLHTHVTNMAELMNRADLALGAGGTTTWERCWLGLPSVIWSLADNQTRAAQTLGSQGGAIYLGKHTEVTSAQIRKAVQDFVTKPSLLEQISRTALRLMGPNGRSGVETVANMLLEVPHVTA